MSSIVVRPHWWRVKEASRKNVEHGLHNATMVTRHWCRPIDCVRDSVKYYYIRLVVNTLSLCASVRSLLPRSHPCQRVKHFIIHILENTATAMHCHLRAPDPQPQSSSALTASSVPSLKSINLSLAVL